MKQVDNGKFFYVLDTIQCNTTTLYVLKHKKNPPKVDSFDIGWEFVIILLDLKLNLDQELPSIQVFYQRCHSFLAKKLNRLREDQRQHVTLPYTKQHVRSICLRFLGRAKKER